MLMMGLRQGIATTLSLLFFSAVLSHAFVLPSWGLNGHLRIPTRCGKGKVATRMMLLPPEAPQSFISTSTNLMIAASRYIKDVPSTLTDMADEAADAVASTPAYTNPDGSYTNAGEVVEEVYNGVNTELPPPYYAVAFALVLLVVSGIQQLSLGNVFDDEEKSASSSGAVARRMNMRNRSFFKKK